MYLRVFRLSGLLLFTVLIAAGSGRSSHFIVKAENAPSGAAVQIDNFSYSPQEIKVKAGTTITWTNRDDIPHTIVSTDDAFKSKALDTDDRFTTTLTKPGTYPYFCSIHPKMTGKIVVE